MYQYIVFSPSNISWKLWIKKNVLESYKKPKIPGYLEILASNSYVQDRIVLDH